MRRRLSVFNLWLLSNSDDIILTLLMGDELRVCYVLVLPIKWFGGAELRSQPQGTVNAPNALTTMDL